MFSKIQAPLTLSGRRSMALQLSQWLMVELSPCAALTCWVSLALTPRGWALDDVVQVEWAAGCGHRLYSDRGPFECPCHWPAAKVTQEGKFGYLELVT